MEAAAKVDWPATELHRHRHYGFYLFRRSSLTEIYVEVGSGSYGGLTGNRVAPTQALRLLPISSIIFDRDLCRSGKW